METGVEKKVNLNALVGLILMMIVYPRRGGPHSEILGQPVGHAKQASLRVPSFKN